MPGALGRYLERCGVEFDCMVNVLTGGDLGQTVSLRTALAAREGRRWGCIGCWLLSRFVQRDHCAHQFDTTPAGAVTYLRAGLAFGAGGAALFGLVHTALTLARAAL